MLASRERRAACQRLLLEKHRSPLVCFTLNIAGEYKLFPLAQKAFACGLSQIRAQLGRHRHAVLETIEAVDKTGCTAYVSVQGDEKELKAHMCAIEGATAIGRLFDIDVLGADGQKVSREALGLPPRRCLICEKPAAVCARSRAHGLGMLKERTAAILNGHFNLMFADRMASLVCKAMLYEACVTPKPGLVDRDNSGAHRDMDIFSFMASASALMPYFRDCALAGIERCNEPPAALLGALRYPGMLAEEAMRRETQGANTHKGLIFSMGILCGAAGRLFGLGQPVTVERLCEAGAGMLGGIVDRELASIDAPATHGERAYRSHRAAGARGEAAAGFPSARGVGLPALKAALREGRSLNDAGALALYHLMGAVVDTNVIARAGKARQQQLMEQIARDIQAGAGPTAADLAALDRQLIAENISPGGSADLLAISYLFYFLESETF